MTHDETPLHTVTYRAHVRSVLFTSATPVAQRLTVERDPRNKRKFLVRRWNDSGLSGIGVSSDRFSSVRSAVAYAEGIRDRETAVRPSV